MIEAQVRRLADKRWAAQTVMGLMTSERVASEARSGAARVNLLLTGSISDGMLLCRYVTMIARV